MAAEQGGTTEGPCGAGNTRQRHGLAAPAGDVASSSCPDRVMPDGRRGSKKSGFAPGCRSVLEHPPMAAPVAQGTLDAFE
jgi:hypothetical protein